MRLSSCIIKKSCKIFLYISFLCIVILSNYVFLSIFHVTAQPNSDYDEEIELEFGIPTQLSEVSVPSNNLFGSYGITGFSLHANFSNNTGSIWINDINNVTIWGNKLNDTIEISINVNNTSIKQYSLWANSSTLGNNTLYYTFIPDIIHAGNIGIFVVIIFIPTVIIAIIVIVIRRKKEPHSVRVAKNIVRRMAISYEEKHKKREENVCPKCGFKIEKGDDMHCTECGFILKE